MRRSAICWLPTNAPMRDCRAAFSNVTSFIEVCQQVFSQCQWSAGRHRPSPRRDARFYSETLKPSNFETWLLIRLHHHILPPGVQPIPSTVFFKFHGNWMFELISVLPSHREQVRCHYVHHDKLAILKTQSILPPINPSSTKTNLMFDDQQSLSF